MKVFRQKALIKFSGPVFGRSEKPHPYLVITYLVIALSCLIYTIISILFIKHLVIDLGGHYKFRLPDFFVASALLLAGSGHYVYGVTAAYDREDIKRLRISLSILVVSGLTFFIFQTLAWTELIRTDFSGESSNIASYLVVLTGIHFLFLVAGVIVAFIYANAYMFVENEPVKILILTTNPHERTMLRILVVYWKYLIFSWLILFLMMLIAL